MSKILEWNGRDDIDRVSGASLTNSGVEYKRTNKGMAGLFDGSTSAINVGVKDNTGNKTFIGWINAKSLGENNAGHIYSDLNYNNIFLSANKLKISRNGSTTAESADISLNKWIFFVITSTDNGVSNIYIDNSLSGSADQAAGSPQLSSTATFIGNRSGSDRTFDGYIGKIFVYDEILNSNQRTKLYKDFLNAPILAETKYWNGIERNSKPTSLNDNGLVSAYNMTPSSNGVLTDISGNDMNGTIETGIISTLNGLRSSGGREGVTFTETTLSRNSAYIKFRFKAYSLSVGGSYNNQNYLFGDGSKFLRCCYINSTSNLLAMESNTNSVFWIQIIPNPIQVNTYYNVVVSADNGTVRTYINGVLADTRTPADDLTLSHLFGSDFSSSDMLSNAEITDFRIGHRPATEQEAKDYHNSFNYPYYTESFKYEGDGNKALGHIPGTGDFEIKTVDISEEDLPLKRARTKYYECTSAGTEAWQSKQAYGTWEFDIMRRDGNSYNFMPIASVEGPFYATGQNGYLLQSSFFGIYTDSIALWRIDNGISTELFNTTSFYISDDAWYRIKITRTLDGQFAFYIKGGNFGDDYVLIDVTGGAGTNPIIDNTYTTSEYSVLDFDTGDSISNIRYSSQVEQ